MPFSVYNIIVPLAKFDTWSYRIIESNNIRQFAYFFTGNFYIKLILLRL